MLEVKIKNSQLRLTTPKSAMNLYQLLLPFVLIVLFSMRAHASNEFFDMSLEELMHVDVTIATKTHVEFDSAPGMVSVLSGLDLENKGYESLWEALSSLPGIQISMESTGDRILIVRGVGKTFSSGKVKVLLNGVGMNSTIRASSETVMNLPIQQIDKIELIRGPGSAVHGEFSYVGVINVITRQSGNNFYVSASDGNSIKTGALFNWQESEDFKVSLNVSLSDSDGKNVKAGIDSGGLLFGLDGYSPGLVNNKRSDYSALLNMDYKDLHFSLQWLNSQRGDHFGINDYLPPDERENRIENEDLALHVNLPMTLSASLKANLSMNWLNSKSKTKEQFVLSAPLVGGLATDPDSVSNKIEDEERIEFSFNLTSHDFKDHVLFSELSLSKIEVKDAKLEINLNPNTFATTDGFFDYPSVVSKGADREIISLTLQDEFFITEDLTLTSGVRYDHYDQDVGTGKTPRIALVYHADELHTYRVQYAEAFRPPTLLEIHGAFSDTVNPEIIDTFEFGHHYQQDGTSLKTVIFYSKLKDLITFINVSPFGFSNASDATLKGVEFEVIHKINNQWSVDSNLSLLDTRDDETGDPLFGSADVMANVSVYVNITPKLTANMSINYVGEKHREASDTRGKMEASTLSHVAVNIDQLGDVDGLTLKAGVKNLLGEDLQYQSPVDTYIDDYELGNSRTVWMEIAYDFD